MDSKKQSLIEKAVKEYNPIYPCGRHSSLMDCFTFEEQTLHLWFNTVDKSTHVISCIIDNN